MKFRFRMNSVVSFGRSLSNVTAWLPLALIALAFLPETAQGSSLACTDAVYLDWACADGSGVTPAGTTAIGNWGIRSEEHDSFRGQAFDTFQEVNLASGILRQVLYFSGHDYDQLSTYAYMSEDVTFHGAGTAEFRANLTGLFTGNPNVSYYDYYTFTISAFGPRGDITGSFDLRHRLAGDANLGTNCNSVWALGTVGCTLTSKANNNIDLSMTLLLNDIQDGDTINFVINTQAGAYAINQGGVDFGHTARLGLTTSNGVSWDSASGAFLTQSSAVPEPASLGLITVGLGLLSTLRRLRKGN